ncbi:MAG: Hsp33 family molecular chaperone HslO, partial [Clostridia bacterium]|nr:Hsp33 family molecular chaperone HslO [Clostridia bacterium]
MGRLLKTLIFDDEISLSLLDTTDVVNEAIKIHKLSPLAAAALGRTMTAVAFLASNLKNASDNLSVTIVGDGVGG